MALKSRVTVPVSLQTAAPLSAAMSSWVERGQHALIVDADFPDGRQPLIKLIHILVRQKHNFSLQRASIRITTDKNPTKVISNPPLLLFILLHLHSVLV